MSAERCLHCIVWDAIYDYFRAEGSIEAESGQVMLDERLIYGNLADVLAETVASIPDPNSRRKRVKEIDKRIRAMVPVFAARGELKSKPVRLQ